MALILSLVLFTSCNDKDKAKASYEKGLNMMKYEDYTTAISFFDTAIEIYPKYDEAYYQRGLSKYQLNKYLDALKDCQKANDLNPNNNDYNYQISFIESFIKENAKIKQETKVRNEKIQALENEYKQKRTN